MLESAFLTPSIHTSSIATMVRLSRIPQISVLFTLVLLLGIGHVCELGVFVGIVTSADASAAHDDHHDHDAASPDSSNGSHFVSCDGLAATSTVATPVASPYSHPATTTPKLWAESSVPISPLAATSTSPPLRRPLFLLFATLLI